MRILLLLTCALLAACVDVESYTLGDVRCVEADRATACYSELEADAWVPVLPVCTLDAHAADEVDGWDAPSCAGGQAPDTVGWDDVRCFSGGTQGPVCFGVAGEWAAVLLPACAAVGDTLTLGGNVLPFVSSTWLDAQPAAPVPGC